MKNSRAYANVSLRAALAPVYTFAVVDRADAWPSPEPLKDTTYKFRFSPNLNQAHLVDWLPWGQEAFSKAQEENKPVLLAVSAVWCYWCHVMDETSYSDSDVADFIAQHFVAVRVDSDHRPDVNARYNVGGWPTTAFLTGHGGFIGGATYLPPDQFLAMLAEVKGAYREDKPQVYEHAREMLRLRREHTGRIAAGLEIDAGLLDRAARTVAGAYDVANGGFGDEPKFPNAHILGLLTHLVRTTGEGFYRVMLRKTLDRMAESSIWDKEEGGFFRYCAKADWSEGQMEKLLEDNLRLARVYLDAWQVLGEKRYREVAEGAIDYVFNNLLDDITPLLHGSQGAHSGYFALPLGARRDQPAPPVDPSCYAGANALAVSLFLEASYTLDRPQLRQHGLDLLEALDASVQDGRFSHVFNPFASGEVPAFLGDWAELLNALVAAYGCTGQEDFLQRATSVALEIVDRFVDQTNGGFFDAELDSHAVGYLREREKPCADNLAAALGFLKLSWAADNDDYRGVAEATLSAFANTFRDNGESVGAYGLLVDLWLNPPVEIIVEGPGGDAGTQKMFNAAANVPYPSLDIRPALTQDLEQPARALVCLDTVCLPPVTDPDQLAETVSAMLADQGGHAENIFQQFPAV